MSENNYELQEYSTNTKAVPVNFSNINQYK